MPKLVVEDEDDVMPLPFLRTMDIDTGHDDDAGDEGEEGDEEHEGGNILVGYGMDVDVNIAAADMPVVVVDDDVAAPLLLHAAAAVVVAAVVSSE